MIDTRFVGQDCRRCPWLSVEVLKLDTAIRTTVEAIDAYLGAIPHGRTMVEAHEVRNTLLDLRSTLRASA